MAMDETPAAMMLDPASATGVDAAQTTSIDQNNGLIPPIGIEDWSVHLEAAQVDLGLSDNST